MATFPEEIAIYESSAAQGAAAGVLLETMARNCSLPILLWG